jgi:hypothetical protein
MIKKQLVLALVLLLLIPVMLVLGGVLSSLINPEIAAGHPNYVRNYHLLSLLKSIVWWVPIACVFVLWLLVCFLVIRSKKRSQLWLFLAALGPFGFAVLAMLKDGALAETDWHARFVRNLNGFVRFGYELCTFAMVWVLAYEAMVLKRGLIVRYQAATTGMSIAQIIDQQNASGGMWAFAEGMEVMYLVVLLYLLRPVVFSIVGRVGASMAAPKVR